MDIARRIVRGLGLSTAIGIVAGCAGSVPSPQPSPLSASAGVVAPSATPRPVSTPKLIAPPTPVPLPTVEDAGGTRATVAGDPDWVIVVDGVAWTAAGGGLVPLDPRTGSAGVPVPVAGTTCTALDAGYDRIWAATCDNRSLTAIDPTTRTADPAIELTTAGDVQSEGSVAAGEGGVWVVTTVPELLKVSPKRGEVVGSWPLPANAAGVRAGLGWLWVTSPATDQLIRIDPKDPTRRLEIAVGEGARFLAVGEDAVWTLDARSGTVTKVLQDGSVAATIDVADGPIDGGDIAVGGGSVWARTSDSLVVQIDPATGATMRLGPVSGSGSVAADDTAAWISAHDVSAVWRLPLPMQVPPSP